MIEFKNVSKVYESGNKQVKAVDNVNLHIEKGQICVFLGPSGCGKTTLLRMVNRLIPTTSGSILIEGKDITTLNPIELRRSIGYVIQQVGLFPNMTIEENISVAPNLLGWARDSLTNVRKIDYNPIVFFETRPRNNDAYRNGKSHRQKCRQSHYFYMLL